MIQKEKEHPQNYEYLASIKNNIRNCNYEKALTDCEEAQQELRKYGHLQKGKQLQIDGKIWRKVQVYLDFLQFQSLRAYCLINVDKMGDGMQILQSCLQFRKDHPATLQRLGYAHSREGNLQEALKYYQQACLFQPDDTYITNQILKLQNKLSPQGDHLIDQFSLHKSSSTHEGNKGNKTHSSNKQPASGSKQHVTFGAMEVIQIDSEASDQYFAHIKQQISNLSQVKPKKSILKMSKSLQKNKNKGANSQKQSQGLQKVQVQIKKCLSIKSCDEKGVKWQQQEQNVSEQRPKKKKKSVSIYNKEEQLDDSFKG